MVSRKITLLTTNIGKYATGTSQSALDVLQALMQADHQITVIGSQPVNLPLSLRLETTAPLTWIPGPGGYPFTLPIKFNFREIARWSKSHLQTPVSLYHLLRTKLFSDLVLVNGTGLSTQWRKLKPYLNYKQTAVIVRESPGHYHGRYQPRSLDWAIKSLHLYDNYIFVSSRVRDEWITTAGLPAEKCFYIPNCAREDVIKPLLDKNRQMVRRALNFPMDKFVAVCVAGISYRKGQDILLTYLNDILAQVPDLVLYLVGPISHKEWWKQFQIQLEQTELKNHIHILGKKNNALEYIYAADLVVLPTRAEAMPRVILEAMALKTPVVASNVDGIPELIEDGVSGVLFPIEQPNQVVDAIARVANNNTERHQFAEQAYQTYWSNFSRAKFLQRYQIVLEQLTESSSQSSG